MSESSVVSQLPDEKLKLEGGNDSASPFDSSVVVDAAAEESISLVDNENPYNWSTKKRWLITTVFCLMNFAVSIGASIFTPGIGFISYSFGVSTVVATLGLSFYVLGFSMGPLLFAPMSEVYGRRIVYIPTWLLFCVFQIGCATAQNIETLLICRFFVGMFGSPSLTVAGGSMSDIWLPNELGPPLGLFTMTAFLGPVAGPIVGGFIVEYIKNSAPWRWSFWVQLILSGVLAPNLIWLPETYATTLLEKKAKALGRPLPGGGRKAQSKVFKVAIWRPLEMLVFEPVVILVSVYISFLFGILYLYFGAYPLIFQGSYHFTSGYSGLAFLGIGIGVILSFPTGALSNIIYIRLKKDRRTYPEGRLPMAIVAAVIVPGSIFWFAWSGGRNDVHWIVPVLSGVPFGWSMVVLFISQISFLAEGYLEYSASVIAANTIMRSLFSMAFPLFGPTMYRAMTPEWAGSLLGFIAIAFMPIPWLFFKYGKWLRRNSRFPTKQELEEREREREAAGLEA
ncbi:uncharacterized protein LAJ45_00212 [Morchella importuna]|uniref:uncharacterized protein n=1 Tax=Morchella importuna TaxID=1174673 RepID=UPI001E8D15D0|nr:uncharacterized protein LAJ45_00212 [Morchella importuna]KAH8155203.1 hypothetical protein LAJ45_00212 [Morchella importuna]